MFFPDSVQVAVRKTGCGELAVFNEGGQIHLILKVPEAAVHLLPASPHVRHFFFLAPMPEAPVVGWFFEIQDEDPIRLITYFDVHNPVHNEILGQLPHQKRVLFHFVAGEILAIVATVRIEVPFNAARIYAQAVCHAIGIEWSQYNFDRAKAHFQSENSLDQIAVWGSGSGVTGRKQLY